MKIETRELQSDAESNYTVYDMITERGLTVSVLTLGAAIRRITAKNHKDEESDLVLGFPDARLYETDLCYAGATLAPNAGRIGNAQLPIGPETFYLADNDNGQQLHGGPHNLSFTVWNTESVTCELDAAAIMLSAGQPDGLDGYPGNRKYYITYTLEDTNWLTIRMTATTDRSTYINMSNHTYWHLGSNVSRSGLDHELEIAAGNVCINNSRHLPVDIIPVHHTAFDFTRIRPINASFQTAMDPASTEQLAIGNGYNHAYILNKNDPFRKLRNVNQPARLKRACTFKNDCTGHTIKMYTDAPALVLYSGGFLPDGIRQFGDIPTTPGCAVALEAQDLPDVMHLLPDICRLTTPDRPFHRIIRYHIS